jgi:hypothetical protein
MYIIIAILATVLKITLSQRCKPVQCVKRNDNICYKPLTDPNQNVLSIELSQCKYGQQCANFENDQWNNYPYVRRCTANPYEYRNSYPYTKVSDRPERDYCDVNKQCASGICEYNRCVGVILGEKCTSKNACVWNTYCSSQGTCELRKKLGETCSDNRDCPNNAACNNIGICSALYTVISGRPDQGSDTFCRSGLSVNGVCEDYTYSPCNPETDTTCIATTSITKTTLQYGKCNCHPLGYPVGVCSPVESTNAHWTNYVEHFNTITSNKCPYESSTSCIEISKDNYFNFKLAQASANGIDVESNYCYFSNSSYIGVTFALLALLAIFI